MRRLTLWGVSTVSALVLLFSYRTSTGGSVQAHGPDAAAPAKPAAPVSPGGPAGSPSGAAPPAAPGSGPASTDGDFTGTAAKTHWGPVQVRITVVGGRITAATAVQHPQGNRHEQEINDHALPRLAAEVLKAQSAQIDTVSGGTETSDGYITSLQSAIDAAHLGG